jgi:hypothetical protein
MNGHGALWIACLFDLGSVGLCIAILSPLLGVAVGVFFFCFCSFSRFVVLFIALLQVLFVLYHDSTPKTYLMSW